MSTDKHIAAAFKTLLTQTDINTLGVLSTVSSEGLDTNNSDDGRDSVKYI